LHDEENDTLNMKVHGMVKVPLNAPDVILFKVYDDGPHCFWMKEDGEVVVDRIE
jgi:hypothetical protein